MFQIHKAISLILILLTAFPVYAGDNEDIGNLSPMELRLFEKINQARENPLATAELLGMDTGKLLEDLSDIYDILTQGLLPFTYNEKLCMSAKNHNQDMIENQYYSHDSSDGRTYEQRIAETGYVPLIAGESLDYLAIDSFVEPDKAVDLIFESMFKDELNPESEKKRMILSHDFKEIGVAFGSGRLEIDGSYDNAYVVTCDFGTSAVSSLETEILELVNKARENPLSAAVSSGIHPWQVIGYIPHIYYDVLDQELPPLVMNKSLCESARDHGWDMITNTSPDGRTLDDRIRDKGYEPVVLGEAIGILKTVDFTEPADAAIAQFEEIFRREMLPKCSERYILNPKIKDIGISVISTRPGMDVSETYSDYYVVLLVIDFGSEN
ncbi:MAG: hypothetical protein GY749_32180 [Desulfobacteraceae bacterium]|nr:hypothetical protein [Desulfobacteraceae bacterium]